AGGEPALKLLRQRLRPVKAADPKRVAALLADLGSKYFEERERGARELAALGELAVPALGQEVRRADEVEVKRRVEKLLQKLEGAKPPPAALRAVRAVEALERMGTPAARAWLKALAAGAREARLTREAQAALRRLPAKR